MMTTKKAVSVLKNREVQRDKYWIERDALKDTQIKKAEDIAKLPWHGNHASDNGLFLACGKFITQQKDREVQRKALFLMGKFGMGIGDPVTDKILDSYLSSL